MFNPDADLTLYSEVSDFLNTHDLGYVSPLARYPKDGNHLQINLRDTDIVILYGLDRYYFADGKDHTKPNFWYADCKGKLLLEKHFKSFPKAIKEAVEARNAQIERQQKSLQECLSKLNKVTG